MAPYRPPGRSNRSGRTQADNDVFEGLPVKQWGQQLSKVSLAPPASEAVEGKDDKWGEPPMPRDYQLLAPHTQALLRLARSGKYGTKRKPDLDSMDDDRPDEEATDDSKANFEDRVYVVKRWKPVPEALLEPEHKHFEFLAKRRKGLPSLYGPDVANQAIAMRRTKVRKANPEGEVTVYEVSVPEGQAVEGEIIDPTDFIEAKPIIAVPGTVIEGVGIANEDGVIVAEHLKPSVAPRRNRPPPKKKGGPGRGKKRVTFTNPDGSTYTTIVPNATKIVPQPGQTVKHVSKGEEAAADVRALEMAKNGGSEGAAKEGEAQGEGEGEGEGEGDDGEDEGSDEEGDDDDDREDGELSDEDAPTAGQTPAPPSRSEDAIDEDKPESKAAETKAEEEEEEEVSAAPATPKPEGAMKTDRDPSSSPELPLAKTSHSRQSSQVGPPPPSADEAEDEDMTDPVDKPEDEPAKADDDAENSTDQPIESEDVTMNEDGEGEEDLLGDLEKHLEGGGGGQE